MPDQCKNANRAHTKRLRKPYAKPIARKRLTTAFEEGGTVAIPVRSSPKAQQELTFEGPLLFGITTHETVEAGTAHATGKECPLAAEKSRHQASCGRAEIHPC
jgi:hypothetical protein